MTNIKINKSTNIIANVTNPNVDHPIIGYVWTLDGIEQPNTGNLLNLPAYNTVGKQIPVSCRVINDCGYTDLSETLVVVDPSIIIQNGSFATNLSGWTFDPSTSTGTAVATNGEAIINMTAVQSGSMNQFYQNGISLLPNTNYRLKFDAYVTNFIAVNSWDIEIYIHDNSSPGFPTGHYILNPNIDITLSPSRTTYSRLFSTLSTVPSNIKFRIKFVNVGIYHIDDVVIEPTDIPCPIPACDIIIYQV